MHYTGKECDLPLYTDTYESIKSVPIVQSSTEYENPETGETTILILNEEICMGDQIEHTLVNPKHISYYGIIVQENPFYNALVLISTE